MSVLLSRRFVLAWLVSFFSGLAYFLFVHFPRYLEGLGADEAEIGRIAAATVFAALLIRPMVGRTMDRRGRRPVILAGNAAHVLALLLYLTVHSIGPWLYLVRFIHGFSEALLFASIFTLAADIIPEERRTEGLALFGVSGLLPVAVGGVLGDIILTYFDFTALFGAAIVLGTIALLLALPLRESVALAPMERHPSFLASLTQRDLLPLWWITLVFNFALTAYFTFLRTYVDATGVGSVGAFFAAYASTAIALRVFAGWLPDRIGLKRVLYPAMLTLAAGFVALSVSHSDLTVTLAGVLCGAGHGYVFPVLFALVFGRASASSRGTAAVIFTGLWDLGVVTGAPLLGAVVTRYGYEAMFRISAISVGIGLVTFAIWDRDLLIPRRSNYTRVTPGPYSPGHDAGDPVTEPSQ